MITLRSMLDSEAVRTTVISAAVATFGWAGHTALELRDHNAQLQLHDIQIKSLASGQAATHDVVVRIEGKIDTVNQKIDDDRATRRAR